jgi:hypothetical protein
VPLASALGQHRRPDETLAFPEGRTWVGPGLGHFDSLDSLEVYARLRAWLAEPRARLAGRAPQDYCEHSSQKSCARAPMARRHREERHRPPRPEAGPPASPIV